MKLCILKTKSHSEGFTLVETIVTIFIFSLIMLGTTLILRGMLVNSRQEGMALNNLDQARRIAATFENELRNSAYGSNGSFPINLTSDTEIVFFSTAPLGTGVPSKIRYYISNGILYKGVTNPTGIPLSYTASTEQVTPLLTTLSLGSTPLFYYYDGNYAGTGSPLAQPVNVNSVKFISINLIIRTQLEKNSTTTFTVTGGGTLRNLKTNLGN